MYKVVKMNNFVPGDVYYYTPFLEDQKCHDLGQPGTRPVLVVGYTGFSDSVQIISITNTRRWADEIEIRMPDGNISVLSSTIHVVKKAFLRTYLGSIPQEHVKSMVKETLLRSFPYLVEEDYTREIHDTEYDEFETSYLVSPGTTSIETATQKDDESYVYENWLKIIADFEQKGQFRMSQSMKAITLDTIYLICKGHMNVKEFREKCGLSVHYAREIHPLIAGLCNKDK